VWPSHLDVRGIAHRLRSLRMSCPGSRVHEARHGARPKRLKESRTGGSPSLPSWVGSALPRGPICPAGPAQGTSTGRKSLPTSATTDSWGKSPNPTQRPCSASASLDPTSSGTPTGIFPHTTSTDRHFQSHPPYEPWWCPCRCRGTRWSRDAKPSLRPFVHPSSVACGNGGVLFGNACLRNRPARI